MSNTPKTDNYKSQGREWIPLGLYEKMETAYMEAVETIRKIDAANNSHYEDSVAIYCDKFLENA